MAPKLKIRRAWPIPEVIRRRDAPGQWHIRLGKAATTDIAAGEMVVPLDGEDDGAAWTRRHEMAHVKWSPTKPQGAGEPWQSWIWACEDARVNLLLQRHGFDTAPGYTGREVISRGFAQGAPGMVSMALASCGTTVERDAIQALPSHGVRAIAQQARDMIAAEVTDPDVIVRVSKWLNEQLKAQPGTPSHGACPGHGAGTDPATDPRKTEVDDEEAFARLRRSDLTPEGMVFSHKDMDTWRVPLNEEGRPATPRLIMPPKRPGAAEWGALTIVRPELAVPLPKLQAHGKWRPSDAGAFPRRMERWATDQAVFTTRGRQRGGTILIDGSGSMSMTTKKIEACLTGAPAALIAIYSGRGRTGTLDILAHRGKRVRRLPDRPGGNVVDGPALRWLCEQKAPRVWVSDGGITAAGTGGDTEDSASQAMYQEIIQLCAAYRVRRTTRIENAAACLRGEVDN
jgi:hypothetical protein